MACCADGPPTTTGVEVAAPVATTGVETGFFDAPAAEAYEGTEVAAEEIGAWVLGGLAVDVISMVSSFSLQLSGGGCVVRQGESVEVFAQEMLRDDSSKGASAATRSDRRLDEQDGRSHDARMNDCRITGKKLKRENAGDDIRVAERTRAR